MENLQNTLSIILLLGIVWIYLDKKDVKYWRNYYKKEAETHLHDYEELYFEYNRIEQHNKKISEIAFDLESKLNKAEEIISQQKQELLTKKSKKK